jgi:hypothetical protein
MGRFQISIAAGCLGTALSACTPGLPGESVGTFTIDMKLEENSCGQGAVILTDGQRFAAELRVEDGRCYWRVPKQPMLEGKLDGENCRFTFSSVVASSEEGVEPVCQLLQSAELVTTVAGGAEADGGVGDAGGEPSAITLEASYKLDVAASSKLDCAAALAPVGPFEALPCTVEYTLSGSERESFD